MRRIAVTTPGVLVSSDIGIAQNATLKPIGEIAARLGIPAASIENYGHYKAKIALDYIDSLKDKPDGKLILVTALSPPPQVRARRPRRWDSETRSTRSARKR